MKQKKKRVKMIEVNSVVVVVSSAISIKAGTVCGVVRVFSDGRLQVNGSPLHYPAIAFKELDTSACLPTHQILAVAGDGKLSLYHRLDNGVYLYLVSPGKWVLSNRTKDWHELYLKPVNAPYIPRVGVMCKASFPYDTKPRTTLCVPVSITKDTSSFLFADTLNSENWTLVRYKHNAITKKEIVFDAYESGSKLTPHIHAEIIHAWADGESIQWFHSSHHTWLDVSTPSWQSGHVYRIKVNTEDAVKEITELTGKLLTAENELQRLSEKVMVLHNKIHELREQL